ACTPLARRRNAAREGARGTGAPADQQGSARPNAGAEPCDRGRACTAHPVDATDLSSARRVDLPNARCIQELAYRPPQPPRPRLRSFERLNKVGYIGDILIAKR